MKKYFTLTAFLTTSMLFASCVPLFSKEQQPADANDMLMHILVGAQDPSAEQLKDPTYIKLSAQVERELPAEYKKLAGKVSNLLLLDNITDVSQIAHEELVGVARLIEQLSGLFDGTGNGDLTQMFAPQTPEVQEFTPSRAFKVMTGAYILYRKFFSYYQQDGKGTLGFVPRIADYAIRGYALLENLKYQKNTLMPHVEQMFTKIAMGHNDPREIAVLSKVISVGLKTVKEGWYDPDFLDEKVALPLQLLIKTAPAAVWHMMKTNKSYNAQRVMDAGDAFKKMVEDGWNTGDSSLVNVLTLGERTTTDKLIDSPIYRAAVQDTFGLFVKKAAKKLESAVNRTVGASRLATVEKYTLGAVSSDMISTATKKVLTPFMLEKASNALKDTFVGKVMPVYDAYDVGMVKPKSVELTKDSNSVSAKVFEKVGLGAKFVNTMKKYSIQNMGAYCTLRFLRMLNKNRRTIMHWLYDGAAFVGQGFVKTGVLRQNPVRRLGTALGRRYKRLLMNRPRMLNEVLGASYMFIQQPFKNSFFSEKDMPVVQECLSKMTHVNRRLEQSAQLRKVGNMKRAIQLDTQTRLLTADIVEKMDEAGLVGRVCSQMVDLFMLQDFSLGKGVIESLGSKAFVKLAKRYSIV